MVVSAGERTFGVLTKINLMDKGTGAVYTQILIEHMEELHCKVKSTNQV
ncbi:hypothetical protein HanRHA438_Chr02g0091901 [Helianthus annuus]|nr:hypothetical protein HanHA300_Chr02g0067531 [Helianthus annuus]KAJ0941206.1 hypothetical protein HanRHA438_Chr02g0091901 [Helianthus annuus]